MSIHGFILPPGRAATWRGPMASGALTTMIRDTMWGNTEVLMVDMPPGTGDAQISVSQKIPLTGAVVVSTPQEVALADARRGMDAYARTRTEVVGVVENMAYYVERDGERSYVFGRGGARATAEARGVEFLGEVPPTARFARRATRARRSRRRIRRARWRWCIDGWRCG